jgi:hypothetical protein
MTRFLEIAFTLVMGVVVGMALDLGASAACSQTKSTGKEEESKTLDPKAMETVGLLASLYFYQAHMNLGVLADCKAEGVYETKQAKELVMSVLVPLEAVEKRLHAVAKTAPTKEDRATMEQWAKCAVPLRRQGAELLLYWDTGDNEHLLRYQSTRKEAWDGLRALLGLKDTK